jgi:hypothetical protein
MSRLLRIGLSQRRKLKSGAHARKESERYFDLSDDCLYGKFGLGVTTTHHG